MPDDKKDDGSLHPGKGPGAARKQQVAETPEVETQENCTEDDSEA